MDEYFVLFLKFIFWISIIGTVLFIISLIYLIIKRSFSNSADIGIKATLGLILALTLCFVFYRYNTKFIEDVGNTQWYLLFIYSFAFSIIVFPIITRINLSNKAIFSSFICFILTFGLTLSLLLIMYTGKNEENNSIFIPIGFFVGATLYMIIDPRFSFVRLFKNPKKEILRNDIAV